MIGKSKKMFAVLIMMVVAIMVYGFMAKSRTHGPVKKEKPMEPGIPVEAVMVEKGSITAAYSGSANLEVESEALVVAKVPGVVKKIFVEEGQKVKAHQVLAKLADQQYKLELNQTKAVYEKLSNEYERKQMLLKDQIISAEDFERSKFDRQTQESVYQLAKLKCDYTEIRAPIAGVISQRLIKVGNMIELNHPTFKVTGLDPFLAVLHVPEKQMSKLRVGFPAHLAADAVPGEVFRGKVARIGPTVDAATGTCKVTVEVKDGTGKLKPGMFTRIRIIYDTHEDALLVPKGAVISEDTQSSVFVVKNNIAARQQVSLGYSNSSHIEICSGLNHGDRIVTTGFGGLKDGAKIKVVEE